MIQVIYVVIIVLMSGQEMIHDSTSLQFVCKEKAELINVQVIKNRHGFGNIKYAECRKFEGANDD